VADDDVARKSILQCVAVTFLLYITPFEYTIFRNSCILVWSLDVMTLKGDFQGEETLVLYFEHASMVVEELNRREIVKPQTDGRQVSISRNKLQAYR
jgi:hypothetical protein